MFSKALILILSSSTRALIPTKSWDEFQWSHTRYHPRLHRHAEKNDKQGYCAFHYEAHFTLHAFATASTTGLFSHQKNASDFKGLEKSWVVVNLDKWVMFEMFKAVIYWHFIYKSLMNSYSIQSRKWIYFIQKFNQFF